MDVRAGATSGGPCCRGLEDLLLFHLHQGRWHRDRFPFGYAGSREPCRTNPVRAAWKGLRFFKMSLASSWSTPRRSFLPFGKATQSRAHTRLSSFGVFSHLGYHSTLAGSSRLHSRPLTTAHTVASHVLCFAGTGSVVTGLSVSSCPGPLIHAGSCHEVRGPSNRPKRVELGSRRARQKV